MEHDVRWKQRFENFDRAVNLLRVPFERDVSALSDLEKEGTIQRFEVAVELAWKTVKDYLVYQGQTVEPVTPRNVLKEAYSAGIIANGQVWMDMLDHRNLLSHTYSAAVFETVVIAIRDRYLGAIESLRDWLSQEASRE
jgi:nucleotidyltransferase substrate binding protein (TIGR01987 family)